MPRSASSRYWCTYFKAKRAPRRRDATAMHMRRDQERDVLPRVSLHDTVTVFSLHFRIIRSGYQFRDVISCLYNIYCIYVASHCALHCDSTRRAISALEADRELFSCRDCFARVHGLANIIGLRCWRRRCCCHRCRGFQHARCSTTLHERGVIRLRKIVDQLLCNANVIVSRVCVFDRN